MKLVLFDIDGTMVRCRGAGARAMTRVGHDVYGPQFSLDGIDFGGRLDPHLLDEGLSRSGLTTTDAAREQYWHDYVLALDEELHRVPLEVLPGVGALVDALAQFNDVTLGLLTGNIGAAARIKVERANIDFDQFTVTAFGDEAASRDDLAGLAFTRFGENKRSVVERKNVVVIGDTPHDVRCARAHGLRVLAVCTGRHDEESLTAHAPDHVHADLSDIDAVLKIVHG